MIYALRCPINSIVRSKDVLIQVMNQEDIEVLKMYIYSDDRYQTGTYPSIHCSAPDCCTFAASGGTLGMTFSTEQDTFFTSTRS